MKCMTNLDGFSSMEFTFGAGHGLMQKECNLLRVVSYKLINNGKSKVNKVHTCSNNSSRTVKIGPFTTNNINNFKENKLKRGRELFRRL